MGCHQAARPQERLNPSPQLKGGEPKTFADSADYTQQLRRCLHHEALPPDIRAAGALILLYGLRTTDVLGLRRDHVIERRQDHHLQFAGNTRLLPPPLASLLKQLPLRRNNNRSVLRTTDSSAPLLFPGFSDARPLHSGTFGARLLRYGITPHA
jgi:integrase